MGTPFDKVMVLEKVYKVLDLMINFLRPALPFVNAHLTGFYTDNYWDTILTNKSLREDLERKSISEVQECLRDFVNGKWRNYHESTKASPEQVTFETATCINELIVTVAKLQLAELNVSKPWNKLRLNGIQMYQDGSSPLDNCLKFDTIMSSKKTHEVEVMSDFIQRLAHLESSSCQSESYLVDVGSGKGYLSSYLTLLHKFNVLAVDSSSTNTSGCEKRSEKLEKVWSQLVRRAVERKIHGTCTKRGKHWKSHKRTVKGVDTHNNEVCKDDGESSRSNGNPSISSSESSSKSTTSKETNEGEKDNKLLRTLTQFVTPNLDLSSYLGENFSTFATAQGNATVKSPHFGLAGLHTCGNLGVASLKLFVTNENAKFLCNVPCCYHLLDENHLFYPSRGFFGSKGIDRERNGDSKLTNDMVQCILQPTFPISRKLDVDDSSSRICLGRNARMMSSYTIPRMIAGNKGMELPTTIFYRSLLQVLIQRHFGSDYLTLDDTGLAVGKIGNKCNTFYEYVQMGLRNLKLNDIVKPTKAEIEEILEHYSQQGRERLTKYYLFRALFSSVIEGIILLDRLAFLLEQNVVLEAHIVQLFDPSVSPRCHALVAVRS